MATIKLKFRPSTVQGKAGTLCYQLCHRQENRQITTDMRIFPEWWNETKRELVTVPGNERVLTAYRKRAERRCGTSVRLSVSWTVAEKHTPCRKYSTAIAPCLPSPVSYTT